MTPGSVTERLASVRSRIRLAAEACGRDPDSVRLIAVSKRHSVDAIREAYAAGQRDFGESYVQELVEKAAELRGLPGICFHMIGHVQSNKVARLVPSVDVLHSIDRVSLVDELEKRRALRDAAAPLEVLIQVNVGREPQKSGCDVEELPRLLERTWRATELRLVGLMTMPPESDDPDVAKRCFDALRALRDANGGVERLPELSMGMSGDLETAVAAGSTMVRVGAAIFGERPSRPSTGGAKSGP